MSLSDLIEGGNYLTQGYGCTDYQGEWLVPSSWCASQRFHTGIDIGADCFLLVRAPRAGTIVQIGIIFLGDSAVALDVDGENVWLEFGHLDSATVSVGQHVNAGDVIGHIGTKGNSTGCHLHLEARTDGPYQSTSNTIDPSPYLQVGGGGGGSIVDTVTGVSVGGTMLRDSPFRSWSDLSPVGQTCSAGTGVTYTEAKQMSGGSWYDRIATAAGPGDWALLDDDVDTRAAGGTSPPDFRRVPDSFVVVAADSGPHIRDFPSTSGAVVRDAAPGEQLTIDASTKGGDPLPDNWSGQPTNEWFHLAEGWIASAVSKGEPPAGWTHEIPYPAPPAPAPDPTPTPGPGAFHGDVQALAGKWCWEWEDAASYAQLKATGFDGVLIRAANGQGDADGAADARFAANYPIRKAAALAAGLRVLPWTFWYGPGDAGYTEADPAAYLLRCAAHTAARDSTAPLWIIDYESRDQSGLAPALKDLRDRSGCAVVANLLGDPEEAGIGGWDWAAIDAAVDGYAPMMDTMSWPASIPLHQAFNEYLTRVRKPLFPVGYEQDPARIEVWLGGLLIGTTGLSCFRAGVLSDEALHAYAGTTPAPPPPPPLPADFPKPPPEAIAWLTQLVGWLKRQA